MLTAVISTVQAEVNVVASIKPVHALVAAVMEGVGTPDLIIEGIGSPHTYSLKPSQAQLLQNADLVFWIGQDMEGFLEKPIEAIATNAISVTLMDIDGLIKIKLREGGSFENHDHDDHADHDDDHDDHADHDDDHDDHADHDDDHDDHADHDDDHDDHADHNDDHDDHADHNDDHDDHADHDDDHDDHADHDDDHDDHADHDDHDDHSDIDLHFWLDPINAKAMVHTIEDALIAADPEHAPTYAANAEQMMGRLDDLVVEVDAALAPVRGQGYIVFHDAYQYYESRFNIAAVGSITVSPEVMPGVKRVSELQAKVRGLGATCVFSEPQFEPKLVSIIIENTDARTGVLDPLGATVAQGPNHYFTLIRNMTKALTDCLSSKS
jgi:zinc transport system substrate-binding protein